MNYLILGFFTGLSLILAIGAQNIFVIEQGLKKQHIFLVCFICSISDFILIFFGIYLFQIFSNSFSDDILLILNILLLLFLIYFIFTKIKFNLSDFDLKFDYKKNSTKNIIIKTIGFTYLNPHVYSYTVFFLGNLSKNLNLMDKYYFGVGATISSFLFFYFLGYMSNYLSDYLKNKKIWMFINFIIIIFMSILSISVLKDILDLI